MADVPTPGIDGVTIRMGGRDFVVAPLTFAQIKVLRADLERLSELRIGSAMSDDDIDALCRIVAAGLSRNYPEMTADAVAGVMDLGNAGKVMIAILTGNGLKPGEATATSA